MEDPLSSLFNYQESSDQLRQKLLDTMLELEAMRNVKMDLLKLLKMAYMERDQAKEQLHNLVKNLMPFTSNELKNEFVEVKRESLVMVPTIKANSSVTESNSPSLVSSPIDSLLDAVSSPEFSNLNVNVVDSHNLGGYLNHSLVQDFSGSLNHPATDVATAVIDQLAKGKVLPQKGKLLQAVMETGPLLQTLLLAGPLPSWRNPPPLRAIKIPPLNVKDFDAPNPVVDVKSFANTRNSIQKPTLPSSYSSEPTPSLNFAGMASGINIKNHAPSWNLQRH